MADKNKKAQSDILGLVVIVMIFIIVLFFVLFFSLRGSTDDSFSVFDKDLHTINMISALIQANNLDCGGMTTTRLLQLCAWRNNWEAVAGNPCYPEDMSKYPLTPCGFVGEKIKNALDKALYDLNFDYQFYLYRDVDVDIETGDPSTPKIYISTKNCTRGRLSDIQPLDYQGGRIFVRLDICK